jgi:hypothetical protein
MSDNPQSSPDDLQHCHRCAESTDFCLLANGTVMCSACGAIRARLSPALVAPPSRPRVIAAYEGPENPLLYRSDWYFTFGLVHPLHDRYVVLHGTMETTRQIIAGIFGQNWAAQYPKDQGQDVVRKLALVQLDLSLS